jgi:hypothetical protein
MWEPRRLTTLWAFTACYRDSFTLPQAICGNTDFVGFFRRCSKQNTKFRKLRLLLSSDENVGNHPVSILQEEIVSVIPGEKGRVFLAILDDGLNTKTHQH